MSPLNSARLGAVALLAAAAAVAMGSLGGCASDQATNGVDYDAGGGGQADTGGGGQVDTGTTPPYDAGQAVDTDIGIDLRWQVIGVHHLGRNGAPAEINRLTLGNRNGVHQAYQDQTVVK